MAEVTVRRIKIVLALNHTEAGQLLDLLAVEAASEPWAEELFSVLNGDQQKPAPVRVVR